MIERFPNGKLLWINLNNPTAAEVQEVMAECDIPPALLSDFTMPVPKSGAVMIDSMIKITIDFPVVKRIDLKHPYEVKFIIGKNVLITAHYEEMEALDKFKKQLDVLATLHKTSKNANAAHLFFSLISELYTASGTKLDYVESLLTDIESEIFKDNERQMVIRISEVSKKLIAFRHILRTHDEVLRDAQPLFESLFKTTFKAETQALHTLYFDLIRRTNTLFETLNELRETNIGLLTTKQNEVMKILTIMAFITFPLSLLTSTFGMNTTYTPIVGHPKDFWIIVGIMVSATICFFIFFKYKRWM